MRRRAARIFGLTRKSGKAELARAALEAVGYQTRDLLEAMRADWPARAPSARAPSAPAPRCCGSMAAWRRAIAALQFLADILAAPVDRPAVTETTALGAAYLAGSAAGLCPDLAGFAARWRCERRFMPQMDEAVRERKWAGWRDAVSRTSSANADGDQGVRFVFHFRRDPKRFSVARMTSLRADTGSDPADRRGVAPPSAPRSDPAAPPLVRFEAVSKRFSGVTAVDDAVARYLPGRVLRAARPIGLRQDHAVAAARRLRDAGRRAACCSTAQDLASACRRTGGRST